MPNGLKPYSMQTQDVMPVINFRSKFQNLAIRAQVLQTTKNLMILVCYFAEDGKETYKQISMHVRHLVLLIKSFVWWRSQCRAVVLSLSNLIKGKINKREPVNIRLISIFEKGLVLGNISCRWMQLLKRGKFFFLSCRGQELTIFTISLS